MAMTVPGICSINFAVASAPEMPEQSAISPAPTSNTHEKTQKNDDIYIGGGYTARLKDQEVCAEARKPRDRVAQP